MRYAIVIEGEPGNYSAYVPDLPGCVAVGDTLEATRHKMQEAIRFHIEGLLEDDLPVPEPTSLVDYITNGARREFDGGYSLRGFESFWC